MNVRTRFNVISVLGLLFLGLLFHNVSSFRLRIILERESLGYVLGRLPGNPAVLLVAGLAAVFVLLAVVWFINRKLSSREIQTRDTLLTLPLGIVFLAAGIIIIRLNPRFPTPQEWSGFAAVTVGFSLALFAFLTSKRALTIGHLVLFVVAAVVLDSPYFPTGHRTKSKAIHEFMETAMDDLERRRDMWDLADPDGILTYANGWATRNMVYRFDEHLQDVINLEADSEDVSRGVLFEMPQDGIFISADQKGRRPKISGGTQIISDYRGGSLLRTDTPPGLKWSEVGAFHITLKVSSGNAFQVLWGDRSDKGENSIRIPLPPTGESVSFVIKEKIIRQGTGGEVGPIWIIPSNRDAHVEIESFRILDRMHAALRGAPFAAGYENVDDELRKVMFVPAPCRLTYRVQVPIHKPRILFGLTTSDRSIPTTFAVSVDDGGRKRTIFSVTWEDDLHWSDHEVDLSPWAGKAVDITFETTAPSPNLAMWSNPVMLGEPSPAPNIVVYLVDCLRADHLGAYGYDKNTSPFFDSLSAKGTLFERAYSNGPSTKLSLPSLFSSNPVASTGVRHPPDVLPDAFPTLAEILRTMGYSTGAFTANPNAGPFSGTHQGFSSLFDRKRTLREAGIEGNETDAEVLIGDLMYDWILQNKDRNFFLYVHTMDAHGVYDPPETYRHYYDQLESGTPVQWDEIFDPPWESTPTREGRTALYDGEIAYGDLHFKRFVGDLDRMGILDNTIILFLADHGEYFGEHRMWGHHAPCFRQGTHIPLLIVGRGFPEGVRVEQNVQILDIMPTILDAVGLDPDPVMFQGKSLLHLAQGEDKEIFATRTIFVDGGRPGETAFYCGDYHVLPEKNILFDLSADPTEQTYLNEFILDFRLKAAGRKLSETYTSTYAELNEALPHAGGDALDVDPETLKQLRALGYF